MARRFPLHLLSNQPRTRLHGQTDGRRCQPRQQDPRDASRSGFTPMMPSSRNIKDGDVVRVFNDRGSVLAGAIISTAIRREVVQLAVGATFDPEMPGVPGTLDKHGNANVLTLDKGTSKLAQAPSAHTTLVEVEKFTGALPSITAFLQPATTPERVS
ncbi:MAG: molybdopterin dinucleotide binding domain-containing protein [Pseudomonadota bacterium]